MYDWISISLVLSITILCPSVFNIKWIHFDGYYRCMSFWTAIMLWRVNNSSANAHTITLWSRSSLDSLASIAMWNLHPIWNGAYEICFKFFFSFVAKWMRTRHRPKEFAFLLLFSLTYKFVHGFNATYAVRMCFELIERTMMTTTTAAATAIPPITSSAQCCSRCCCYCCRCGCCNYMCTYWVWFKRWERERQREREWEKNRILRERMQKGKLACVCMCEQGIPSCVSRVFF